MSGHEKLDVRPGSVPAPTTPKRPRRDVQFLCVVVLLDPVLILSMLVLFLAHRRYLQQESLDVAKRHKVLVTSSAHGAM